MVNDDYKNKGSEYCIKKIETSTEPAKASALTSTIKIQITTTAKTITYLNSSVTTQSNFENSSNTTQSKIVTAVAEDIKIAPVPNHQHNIFGGVSIPIFVVLGFIGGTFVMKKYKLLEKAHGYVRNRNQRYNGLVENEFDDDDDPLLI